MAEDDERLERRRLEGIDVLGALEVGTGETLDRVARLAAALTDSPSAAVHIIDHELQHRIAAVGAPEGTWPREDSMCRLVVEGGAGIAVEDATEDPRFSYSSFVAGDVPVRFYASAPLETTLYGVLGTVCSWDTTDHEDAERSLTLLEDLAGLVVDRLEAGRALRLLAEEARTDALTGLPNRRMVHDRITADLARRLREGGEVVVAFIDLDRFKPVNDEHGHQVGDEVLRHVADRLGEVVRADEMVGRVGGDEFVIVGTAGMAQPPARTRFTEALELPAKTLAGEVEVSAAIGMASATDEDTAESLLRRADAAMFEDKRKRFPDSR